MPVDPTYTDAVAPSSNIVLTGFMGTGKTTVGRILAAELGFDFVDTDAVIEQRHGPIAEIFRERGEDVFRAIERDLAAELADRSRLVIATGGRMMLDPDNVVSLERRGRVFCLVAEAEEIHRRVTADAAHVERPLLAGADPRARILELLAERRSGYRQFTQVVTDGRSPRAIAAEIAAVVASPDADTAIDTVDR